MDDDRAASWTCEIGVVPFYRIPEGGDWPLRAAVQEAFERMFPTIESSISSGWGVVTPAIPASNFEPNLGRATTEELFRELIARCSGNNRVLFTRAIVLAEMLGTLDAEERDYRTIDNT